VNLKGDSSKFIRKRSITGENLKNWNPDNLREDRFIVREAIDTGCASVVETTSNFMPVSIVLSTTSGSIDTFLPSMACSLHVTDDNSRVSTNADVSSRVVAFVLILLFNVRGLEIETRNQNTIVHIP